MRYVSVREHFQRDIIELLLTQGGSPVTTSSSKRHTSHQRDGHGHPVSGGHHGHRRHRLHSRHHHHNQEAVHRGEVEEQGRLHRRLHSRTSSPPAPVGKHRGHRSESGTDLSPASTVAESGERQRNKEHVNSRQDRDRVKHHEPKHLERRLHGFEGNSKRASTAAAIKKKLRRELRKSLRLKGELKIRRKEGASNGIEQEDQADGQEEAEKTASEQRHRRSKQLQPEAPSRKRGTTSSAVADRDSGKADKQSAVKGRIDKGKLRKHRHSDRAAAERKHIPLADSGQLPSSPSSSDDPERPARVLSSPTDRGSRKRSSSSSHRHHSESGIHRSHRHRHHSDSHSHRNKQHKHKHTRQSDDEDTPSIDESYESKSASASPIPARKDRSSPPSSSTDMSSDDEVVGRAPASSTLMRDESDTEGSSGNSSSNKHSVASEKSRTSTEAAILPSIDVQIQQVMELANRPIVEGQLGYLVSCSWLNRVLARCSNEAYLEGKTIAKDATEGEIGQIDNSDLVLSAPRLEGLKDTNGRAFTPIKPGLTIGDDFEVLPEDAWQLIKRWYGLKPTSPTIIREAHNTATDSTLQKNIQYELRPPIFSVVKLSHAPASVFGSDGAPLMVVASRNMSFNAWLKCLKPKVGIPLSTKVRVWRIINADASPLSSPVMSPGPKIGTRLVAPVPSFASLETGSQRELIEAKDQTANEKYNGNATLDHYGLGGEEEVVVLEEQLGGKVWCADVTAAKAAHFIGVATPGVPAGKKEKGEVTSKRGKDAMVGNGPTGAAVNAKSPDEQKKEERQKRQKEKNGIRRRKDGKAVGVTGLVNLGNTCYMNSALQCIRSVEELTRYFLADRYRDDLNPSNPLGHEGNVARAYAHLLHQLFDVRANSAFSPRQFKNIIGRYGPSFSGYGQQDSQEFIMFLLDGLQEDLNRIQKKPYIEKPDSTDDMVNDKAKLIAFAEEHWRIYKARNDSVITDLFAGMYKSTLHCPECDKVSIIFDPFHNLTLQLPVENTWRHPLMFFPLYGKPILMDIEIEKNSSVKALKAHVARKLRLPSDAVTRLIFSEVYHSRFYRMFDNQVTLADSQIEANDSIAMFEVETTPTSYNADYHRANQGYRSMLFGSNRDDDAHLAGAFDGPKGDRILVPIYTRLLPSTNSNSYNKPSLKGHPGYVVVTREEAFDYDSILRKVLGFVAGLTTRDVLGEASSEAIKNARHSEEEELDDAMVTDEAVESEPEESGIYPNIKASSVKSEDGMVDVTMTDAHDTGSAASHSSASSRLPRALRADIPIPRVLRSLFEVKYTHTNEACPTSIGNETADFNTLSSRLPRSRSVSRRRDNSEPGSTPALTDADDEATFSPALKRTTTITHSEIDPESASEKTLPGDDNAPQSTASSRRSSSSQQSQSVSRPSQHRRRLSRSGKDCAKVPLIRPGEAIILDWEEEAYDALFGARHPHKGGLRGSPAWENAEKFDDPELNAKRIQRNRVRSHGISLEDCLDEFGREEILSANDAWYCPRCKTHRRASKKFELWRTPDILVMHLKRFSSNRIFRDKLDTLVDFPQELDMTGRVMYPEPGKSQVYELVAVDNHYGGLGGGHYTAYAKNFVDGNWYDYNDSSAHRVDPSKAVTRSAYLLFYRRKSVKPLGGPYLEELVTRSRQENDSSSSDSDSDDSASSGSNGSGPRRGGVFLPRNENTNNKIPNLDRENITLPKTITSVPRIRSTASIGVPAKMEENRSSPLGALQSAPGWSFPSTISSTAPEVGADNDEKDNASIPGSYPSDGAGNEATRRDSADAGDMSFEHIIKPDLDEDSEDEMPVREPGEGAEH